MLLGPSAFSVGPVLIFRKIQLVFCSFLSFTDSAKKVVKLLTEIEVPLIQWWLRARRLSLLLFSLAGYHFFPGVFWINCNPRLDIKSLPVIDGLLSPIISPWSLIRRPIRSFPVELLLFVVIVVDFSRSPWTHCPLVSAHLILHLRCLMFFLILQF